MPPRASPSFTLFSNQSFKRKEKKSLYRLYKPLTEYLFTHQILLSNSSNSSLKYPLKFFFLTIFLKSSNLI